MDRPVAARTQPPADRGRIPAGSIAAATATGDRGVRVSFSGGDADFHASWLRDQCPCVECRIVQTDERRLQPWSIDIPVVRNVDVVDGTLVVVWADGHRSEYSRDAFGALETATLRGDVEQRLWAAGDEVEQFDHDQVLADDVTRRQFYEAFRRDGALVVVNSPTTPGLVEPFMRSLGIVPREFALGRIFDIVRDPKGFNIAYTDERVPPHDDFSNYTNPPSGQVLAMLANDATGGESFVVDGFQVLHQLAAQNPAAVDVLARVPVGFRQYSSTADAFTRAPLVRRDRDGRFLHLRFSNQLMQPLAWDDPDLDAWYDAYRTLGAMLDDEANQIVFRLQAGHWLFVDNHRVLHARKAYVPNGRRHLQDAYFDTDEITGAWARLTGAAVDAMRAGH
jgi:gamma-butyrobetaine dioxygenase